MKLLFPSILFILLSSNAKAQYWLGAQYGLGLVANDGHYKSYNYNNLPAYELSTTLYYPLKGNHVLFNSGLSYVSLFVLKYISIPVNLKLCFTDIGNTVKPYLNFGIYNSYQLTSKENFSSFDFGIDPGLGLIAKVWRKIEINWECLIYFGTKTAYVETIPSQTGKTDYLAMSSIFAISNFGVIYRIEK